MPLIGKKRETKNMLAPRFSLFLYKFARDKNTCKETQMKHFILSLVASLGLCASCQADDIPVLEPQEFVAQAKADGKAVILDVRTPEEYAAGHIKGAQQLDYLDTKLFDKGIKKLKKSRTYYVYCRSGKRSHAACQKMQRLGLRVVDLKGGYLNFTAQGFETQR